MTQKIATMGILLALMSHGALGQCRCPEEKGDLVFSYEFDRGPKLIICGFANRDSRSAVAKSYSDITVINCRDNQILLSIEGAETALALNQFRFYVREGCVMIQQLIWLPSDPGWARARHPFFEKTVTCTDGRLTISEWKNIFAAPPKKRVEINGFLDTYLNHFEMTGDYLELPGKLVLCALNGSPRAEQLLMSFPKDHPEIFDGAIAETYGDMLEFYRDIMKK